MIEESDLRALMRAHDVDVPGGIEFHAPPARRRPARLVLAMGAAVLVTIAATTIAVTVRGTATPHRAATPVPGAQLSCPSQFRSALRMKLWVPHGATIPDAGSRLIPSVPPDAAVLCSFAQGVRHNPAAGSLVPLVNTRSIRNLRVLANALATEPSMGGDRGCLYNLANTDDDNYLLGLSYPTGFVWVSIPGDHCAGSGNGQFQSRVNLRSSAAAADVTGRWPKKAPADGPSSVRRPKCDAGSEGRLGDTAQLVPDGWDSLMICRSGAKMITPSDRDSEKLVQLLNRLPKRHDDGMCESVPGASNATFVVTAHYPSGPSETLSIYGDCTPSIDNGGLQAVATTSLISYLGRLVNP